MIRASSSTWSFTFVLPYLALLIVGLMIPSDGNHGFFSLKSLSFVFTVLATGLYALVRNRFNLHQVNIIVFTASMITFLLTWLVIGVIQDDSYWDVQKDQFKIFVITIFFVVVTLYFVREKLITPQTIIRTAIYANFVYSTSKCLILILGLFGVINILDLFQTMGMRVMSMGIFRGVMRIQTSVDIITPYMLFFVLQSHHLGITLSRKFKGFYYFFSAFALLLSFSRFLFMVAFASCFLYWLSLSLKKWLKILLVGLMFTSAFVAYVGVDNVVNAVVLRFFSSNTSDSDETRYIQIRSLLAECDKYPILGKGIGGFAEDCLRDTENKHSYEVQWIAFLMQFGMVGILILCIPLALIAKQLIVGPFSRIKVGFLLLYLLWVLSGFTNPFLISLTSGIVYSLFYLAGLQLNQTKNERR